MMPCCLKTQIICKKYKIRLHNATLSYESKNLGIELQLAIGLNRNGEKLELVNESMFLDIFIKDRELDGWILKYANKAKYSKNEILKKLFGKQCSKRMGAEEFDLNMRISLCSEVWS